jgi:glycosyltransferase involved in cell wall biosynthesis
VIVLHLTASTFFGGPERQLLGLAGALPPTYRTLFVSFAEGGRSAAFLKEVSGRGFEGLALAHDTPRIAGAARELAALLRGRGVGVLCCHGYKADVVGRWAARRAGVPAVAVSRGWTGENARVRFYERLDRLVLPWMDRVVCVSGGQARKVRRAGVRPRRVAVIHNAIHAGRFGPPDPAARQELCRLFARPPRWIVGAAGRLSPEKGFDLLVDAAAAVCREQPEAGFVLFGDGVLREVLRERIVRRGLGDRFVLGGFRPDLDRFFGAFDVLAQSSHTEGLPNVILEACAARTPVVATAVGGTPEVVTDGVTGHLVRPGDPDALARRLVDVLSQTGQRREEMADAARRRVLAEFTFPAQARRYHELFEALTAGRLPGRQRAGLPQACPSPV